MNWEQLLHQNRVGKSGPGRPAESRSEFQRDFDRIVFSTAFRRLQSKTQVFPLPETDFIHTRLTHSLEASCVGRSLGRVAAGCILDSCPEAFGNLPHAADDIAAIVAAACLAHDIGNPPFGHSGEDAIAGYFQDTAAERFLQDLTDARRADLTRFEGNAMGFRLLTHTLPSQSLIPGGLQLTCATLGAFTKYPRGSVPCTGSSGGASEKKFGFFQSEAPVFQDVANAVGLKPHARYSEGGAWHRHPLAFLVEAADDICYTIMDLEDGYKMKLAEFRQVRDWLLHLIDTDYVDPGRLNRILDEREKLGYLRANAINSLVHQTARLFLKNHEAILEGAFDTPLTELIPGRDILQEIKAYSFREIYAYRKVTQIETAGFEVLSGLLDAFLNAIMGPDTARNRKTRALIPSQYLDPPDSKPSEPYDRIMRITQFLAEMTDTYAINTYRSIKGISLPVC